MIGELGLPIFVTARHLPELRPDRAYRAAYEAAGHAGHRAGVLSVPTYVGETAKRRAPTPSQHHAFLSASRRRCARTSSQPRRHLGQRGRAERAAIGSTR